jgi:N6-L-threonylcarbamoyladenine synthase
LGTTLDDAVGEAFDKTAKMMGMEYPGGVQIEQWAQRGDPKRFQLPKPLCNQPGCNFSFSGLKTAVRIHLEKLGALQDQDRADMAASLQKTIGDILENRCRNALQQVPEVKHLVVGGGVAANQYIRQRLTALAWEHGIEFCAPPMELCTDNGAMIAWAGVERLRLGMMDSLNAVVMPRCPLG